MPTHRQCPLDRLLSLPATNWSPAKLTELEKICTGPSCPSHDHPSLKELVLKAPNEGTTPLLIAVHFGDMKLVQRIVESWGADVGAAGSINLNQFSVRRTSSPSTFLKLQLVGVTPLFIAALNKNSQIVRYLVAKGADVSAGVLPSTEVIKDRLSGLSPLHAAFYSEDVYAPKSSEQQLDIIRFLVASGADPSVLSSNGTPVWAMGSNYLKQLGPEEDDHTAGWSKPEATSLLLNLGMNLSQSCPIPFGRTLLHHLLANPVSDSYNDGVELANLLELILERSGADLLQVRDEDGVTPIMAAALECIDQGPKMQLLKTLLERDDILPTDKINALEAAAAVLLFSRNKPSAHHFEALCDFLAQAQTLRRSVNCPLIPETSTNVETTEWITSVSNHREIEQRIMSERLFQSIFIRLRIFSEIAPTSIKALLRYVIHPCTKRICNGLNRDPSNYPAEQVLYVYWDVLEAIGQCNSTEEDITDGTICYSIQKVSRRRWNSYQLSTAINSATLMWCITATCLYCLNSSPCCIHSHERGTQGELNICCVLF